MYKATWLDRETEAMFEDEIDELLEDQEFLEHYYAICQLLSAIDESLDEEDAAA